MYAENTKTMYRYFPVPFYALLKSIGAGMPSMAYTQYACGWIRPTSLTVELSLFGLRTTIPLRESRITASLQPLQVLCLTIKQIRQDGVPQMATPSPRKLFSRPTVKAAGPRTSTGARAAWSYPPPLSSFTVPPGAGTLLARAAVAVLLRMQR